MAKQVSTRRIKNRPRGGTGRSADTSAEVVRTPAVRREPRELTAKLGRRVAAYGPRSNDHREPSKVDCRFRRGVERNARIATRFFTIVAMALVLGALASPQAGAQGSRRDDIVFGPSGHPIAGAAITVCQPSVTGTPRAPLATLHTDATLTTTSPNPFQADGIGNYHFYAPAGRYLIQISGPQITGALNYPDVIQIGRV